MLPRLNMDGDLTRWICESHPMDPPCARKRPQLSAKSKKKFPAATDIGFCEYCYVHFNDVNEHRKTASHVTFVISQTNYQKLDEVISDLPSLDTLTKIDSGITVRNFYRLPACTGTGKLKVLEADAGQSARSLMDEIRHSGVAPDAVVVDDTMLANEFVDPQATAASEEYDVDGSGLAGHSSHNNMLASEFVYPPITTASEDYDIDDVSRLSEHSASSAVQYIGHTEVMAPVAFVVDSSMVASEFVDPPATNAEHDIDVSRLIEHSVLSTVQNIGHTEVKTPAALVVDSSMMASELVDPPDTTASEECDIIDVSGLVEHSAPSSHTVQYSRQNEAPAALVVDNRMLASEFVDTPAATASEEHGIDVSRLIELSTLSAVQYIGHTEVKDPASLVVDSSMVVSEFVDQSATAACEEHDIDVYRFVDHSALSTVRDIGHTEVKARALRVVQRSMLASEFVDPSATTACEECNIVDISGLVEHSAPSSHTVQDSRQSEVKTPAALVVNNRMLASEFVDPSATTACEECNIEYVSGLVEHSAPSSHTVQDSRQSEVKALAALVVNNRMLASEFIDPLAVGAVVCSRRWLVDYSESTDGSCSVSVQYCFNQYLVICSPV
jgi:hypothetical protein